MIMNEYKSKCVTADEAVKVIKDGDWVEFAWGASYAGLLAEAIERRREELHDVNMRGGVILKPLPFIENDPEMHYVDVIQRPESDFPYSKVETDERYEWKSGRGEVPIYVYEDKVIWGLTARLVLNIVRIMEEVK